jgi:predicted MPP superfamily phosphohydrolase
MEFSRRGVLTGLVKGAVGLVVGDEERANLVPRILRVNVPVKDLPRRLDGFRIGQISDTHIGATLTLDHLVAATGLFRRNPPDMLVMTGDLLDDASLTQGCLDVLATVKAPHGNFFIMGNHDNYAGRDNVIETARAHATVKLLLDEERRVHAGGAHIHVSGLDYSTRERVGLTWRLSPLPLPVVQRSFPSVADQLKRATDRRGEADFRLCLAHHPDSFELIADRGVELTLSGHTHGGQVAPLGTLLARTTFKYVLGLYERQGRHLYVNGGTGHWLPLRVGVPAEVTELTLRRV